MLKKTVVLKRRKMNLKRFDYRSFFFFSLFLCGLILGVLTVKNDNNELNNALKSFLINYISRKNSISVLECLLDSSFLTFIIPIFTFVLGLCAVGGPIIIATPTFVGIVVGMATGIFYSQYALQGLGYCALVVMPCTAITVGTLLKCCNESINMSFEIIYMIIGGKNSATKTNELKEYCLKYLVLCVPFVLAAVLNTVSFKIFGGLFSFVWVFCFYTFNFCLFWCFNTTQRVSLGSIF